MMLSDKIQNDIKQNIFPNNLYYNTSVPNCVLCTNVLDIVDATVKKIRDHIHKIFLYKLELK